MTTRMPRKHPLERSGNTRRFEGGSRGVWLDGDTLRGVVHDGVNGTGNNPGLD